MSTIAKKNFVPMKTIMRLSLLTTVTLRAMMRVLLLRNLSLGMITHSLFILREAKASLSLTVNLEIMKESKTIMLRMLLSR
jgi:hypothetical protein